MKTQEQLSKMTEQELTFELACLVFGEDECYKTRCLQVAEVTSGAARYVDINDWSWLMPLAAENNISITSPCYDCPLWTSYENHSGEAYSSSDSPQRAIATCLILKLQEIQE